MTENPSRAAYTIILVVLVFCGIAYFKSSSTTTSGCLDMATAKPALDDAAARLDASAAKRGDTTTAASEMRSAAGSLRTAADALRADAAVSQPDTRAAEAYEKAASAYERGDDTGAGLYAMAAVAAVKTSTAALQQSRVPRCR
jgi:hypothetical protein